MSYTQSSVSIILSANQVLSALCRTDDGKWIRSTIDLNTVLGNCDGCFQWGAGNFSLSAKDVTLKDGGTLSAFLRRKDGSWSERPAEVNLTEHITNDDGALRECQHADLSIVPSFLEKLDVLSGLLRSRQIAAKNSEFELEFTAASNSRLMLQELEVVYLRLRKLASVISGEFDEESEDTGRRVAAEAVLRPMIKAFENVRSKGERSMAVVSRICNVTLEYITTNLPALRRDVESLRLDIDLQTKGAQVSLATLQEAITSPTEVLQVTQKALKTAKSMGKKTHHLGREALVRPLSQRTELEKFRLLESEFSLALHACEDLSHHFHAVGSGYMRIKTKSKIAIASIETNLFVAGKLESLAREMEDKACMLEQKVSKRDYATYILGLLDRALPAFAVVGDVSELLTMLTDADDQRGSVKELNTEIGSIRGRLGIVA